MERRSKGERKGRIREKEGKEKSGGGRREGGRKGRRGREKSGRRRVGEEKRSLKYLSHESSSTYTQNLANSSTVIRYPPLTARSKKTVSFVKWNTLSRPPKTRMVSLHPCLVQSPSPPLHEPH